MLLKDCKILQQYRHRDETETELALLMSEFDQSQQFAQVRLASAKSRDTAKIRFHNVFEGPVRALWMDFDGHEVRLASCTADISASFTSPFRPSSHNLATVQFTVENDCAGCIFHLDSWRG